MTDDQGPEFGRYYDGLDLARVPFEITRAVESAGLPVEQLQPGLGVRIAKDDVVAPSQRAFAASCRR